MAFYKTLKTIFVYLFVLLAAPMVSAADESVVDQAQIEAWTKTGLDRFSKGDMLEAIQQLEKAANLGHAEAQAMLGYIYYQGSETELALPLFEKAVAQGNPLAMTELSVFYSQGIEVKKDPIKAMDLLQQAAAADYLPAISALAAAYENGTPPFKVDFEQALKNYRLAADKLNLVAIARLIRAHQNGELGLAADQEKAQAVQLHYSQLADAQELKRQQEAEARAAQLKLQKETKSESPAKAPAHD